MKKFLICALLVCNFAHAACPEYRDDLDSELEELNAELRSINNDIAAN